LALLHLKILADV